MHDRAGIKIHILGACCGITSHRGASENISCSTSQFNYMLVAREKQWKLAQGFGLLLFPWWIRMKPLLQFIPSLAIIATSEVSQQMGHLSLSDCPSYSVSPTFK